ERALKESEARFRRIVETASEGIVEMDRRFVVTHVNSRVAEMLGYAREEIVGRSILEFMPAGEHETQLRELRERMKGFNGKYERQLICRDGSIRWVLTSATPLFGESGEFLGSFVMLTDVTERHKAEEALREGERRLAQIIEHLPDATLAIDREGKVIAWNRAIEEMTGIPAAEMIGRGDFEYAIPFYGERRPILIDLLSAPEEELARYYTSIRREGAALTAETLLPVLRGERRVLWAKATPLCDEKGERVGAVESIRDLTWQKEVEEALREREEMLESYLRNLPVGLFRTTAGDDGRIVMANPVIARMHGYDSVEEMRQQPVSALYVDPEERSRLSRAVCEQGEVMGAEVRLRKRDGGFFWAHISARAVRDAHGSVLYLDGVIEDITPLKEAELRLRDSEREYRTIFENTGTAMAIIEEDTTISLANRFFAALSGYTLGEIQGKKRWTEFVVREDLERMLEQHRLRRQGASHALRQYQFRFLTKSGETRDISLVVEMIPGTRRSVASLLDITEQKKAVRALEEQEERYRTLAETAPAMIYVVSSDGRIEYVNTHAAERFKSTPQELQGKQLSEIFSPAMAERHLRVIRQVVESREPLSTIMREEFNDGPRWVDIRLTPLRCGRGAVQGVLGIFLDITQRIEMEQRIRESEEKFRNLFENASDAIFLCEVGEDGLPAGILEANMAACAMLGYSREELLGGTLQNLAPQERKGEIAGSLNALKDAGHLLYESEFMRRNRTRVPVEVGMHLFTLGRKRVALGIARDITDRKIAQRIEKEAFEQIERNIMQLSILNDHIRNPLAVIVAIADMEGGKSMKRILEQAREIDRIITELDMAWLESEKIREFMRKHYGLMGRGADGKG
ncbi:MAG: PAS domain S-box protein, partial [Methanomicrobiales archaeon]|nr:PAS domain S-box protein [Methanomicrobiales archaeon]